MKPKNIIIAIHPPAFIVDCDPIQFYYCTLPWHILVILLYGILQMLQVPF